MTASDDLLRRLESDEELASLPMLLRDFDVKRRDPVEELALANRLPLTPVAGDGGMYFLCGEQGEPDRPVLVPPFQDADEGTPFNDFAGRLGDWPWPAS